MAAVSRWSFGIKYLKLTFIIFVDSTIMESPESRIVPTEDMNTVQLRISGERFLEVILEVCDNCNWSLQCINHKGIVRTCPSCRSKVSLTPMNIDEVAPYITMRRGMTMIFDRRKPMR